MVLSKEGVGERKGHAACMRLTEIELPLALPVRTLEPVLLISVHSTTSPAVPASATKALPVENLYKVKRSLSLIVEEWRSLVRDFHVCWR